MAPNWREPKKHRHRLTLRARLGRQDKRPAVGPAHVVVWVRDFPASATEPAGAATAFPNAFNAPSAIAMLIQEFPA